jgi:hypothetical protein
MESDPAHQFMTAIVRPLTEHLAQQPALPGLDVADLANGGRGYFGQAEAAAGRIGPRGQPASSRKWRPALKASRPCGDDPLREKQRPEIQFNHPYCGNL